MKKEYKFKGENGKEWRFSRLKGYRGDRAE